MRSNDHLTIFISKSTVSLQSSSHLFLKSEAKQDQAILNSES